MEYVNYCVYENYNHKELQEWTIRTIKANEKPVQEPYYNHLKAQEGNNFCENIIQPNIYGI